MGARRSASSIERVRQRFPGVSVTTVDRAAVRFDIAINSTSLGMRSDDELPLSRSVTERSSPVAECVIAPEMTRQLIAAREHGCAIHTGVPMRVAQLDMMLTFIGARRTD